MHRDLKPANILVQTNGRVKIGDLGLARLYQAPLQSLHQSDRVVVTIWYRPPELLLGSQHYTPSIDCWAMGCIMAELLLLRPLFKGEELKPEKNTAGSHPKVGGNASTIPFQKDQVQKIIDVLGMPSPASWTNLAHLPEYPKLKTMKSSISGASTSSSSLSSSSSSSSFGGGLVEVKGKACHGV